MEIPAKYQDILAGKTNKRTTEYSDLVSRCAKFVGQPYIVLHQRLEKIFEGKSTTYVLSFVRDWYYEAEKSENPGMIFNAKMKQYKNLNI